MMMKISSKQDLAIYWDRVVDLKMDKKIGLDYDYRKDAYDLFTGLDDKGADAVKESIVDFHDKYIKLAHYRTSLVQSQAFFLFQRLIYTGKHASSCSKSCFLFRNPLS